MKYKYLDNASIYGEYINGKASSADGNTYTKRNAGILGTDYWFTKSVVAYLKVVQHNINMIMMIKIEITKSA